MKNKKQTGFNAVKIVQKNKNLIKNMGPNKSV